MVVESLLGAAWAYGSSAYTYNMGRYQFDSGQKQNTAHQVQTLRISLWSLFREDVRDLFGITTSNLSTYMLIGTLFLGLTTNMIWNVMTDFPPEPPFLALFYCNSVYASTAYGVLGVWLAMHGTIAAHSASVKVLTQAVRPHIPTAKDVSRVGYDLSQYEASPETMLQAPNVLGWRGRSSGEQCPKHGSFQGKQASVDRAETTDVAREQGYNVDAGGGLEEDPDKDAPGPSALMGDHVQIFRELQPTYLTFEAYSRVCLTVSAHELLIVFAYYMLAHMYAVENERTSRSKHPELASWAGVVFLAFVGSVLFKLDLFIERSSMRIAKMVLLGAPLLSVAAVALWAEDQACRRQGKPDVVPDIVPQIVALFSCILHLLLEGLLLWEARPHGEAKLPTCFRSVQYTDLFGWWYESANTEMQSRSSNSNIDQTMSRSTIVCDTPSGATASLHTNQLFEAVQAARQIKRLSRQVNGTLSCANLSEHLTSEDLDRLNNLNSTLELQSQTLRESELSGCSSSRSSLAVNEHDIWLQCQYDVDAGRDMPYFVNSSSGEVKWETPSVGKVLNVDAMAKAASELCDKASRVTVSRSEVPNACPPARASQQVRFETEVELQPLRLPTGNNNTNTRASIRSVGSVRSIGSGAASKNFEPMRRRPKSSKDSSSMAWKYFAQVTLGVVCLWTSTFVWVLFNLHTVDYLTGVTSNNQTYNPDAQRKESFFVESAGSVSASAHLDQHFLASGDLSSMISIQALQMEIKWPHQRFRPRALACRESDIYLAEQYAVYNAPAEYAFTDDPSVDRLVPVLVAPEIPVPWRAIATVSFGDRTFFLESTGLAVYERSSSRNLAWRRWRLGRSAGFHLLTITGVEGDMAKTVCQFLGKTTTEWALFAATNAGEVVSLCPFEDERLEPVHVIVQLHDATEISGFSFDHDHNLWIISHSNSIARLHSFTLDGTLRGLWQLPEARHWATGVCVLRGSDLLALAVSSGARAGKIPELWRFSLGVSTTAAAE